MLMTRKVNDLKPHPVNERIYAGGKDADLMDSIPKVGILEALAITRDNLIINGARRWFVAKRLHIEEVPVRFFHSEDELDIKEAIVHFNRTREKTPYQKCEEATVLMEVEKERAKRRMEKGGQRGGRASGASRREKADTTPEPVETTKECETFRSPLDEQGRASKKVAETLKVSDRTAEKMVAIGEAVKEAQAEGDTEKVEKIKEGVNTRGVDPVFEELRGPKKSEPNKTKGRTGRATPGASTGQAQILRQAERLLNRLRKLLRTIVKRGGWEERLREWCENNGINYDVFLAEKAEA